MARFAGAQPLGKAASLGWEDGLAELLSSGGGGAKAVQVLIDGETFKKGEWFQALFHFACLLDFDCLIFYYRPK